MEWEVHFRGRCDLSRNASRRQHTRASRNMESTIVPSDFDRTTVHVLQHDPNRGLSIDAKRLGLPRSSDSWQEQRE